LALATYLLANELTYSAKAADGVNPHHHDGLPGVIERAKKNALHIDPVPFWP